MSEKVHSSFELGEIVAKALRGARAELQAAQAREPYQDPIVAARYARLYQFCDLFLTYHQMPPLSFSLPSPPSMLYPSPSPSSRLAPPPTPSLPPAAPLIGLLETMCDAIYGMWVDSLNEITPTYGTGEAVRGLNDKLRAFRLAMDPAQAPVPAPDPQTPDPQPPSPPPPPTKETH